VEVEKNKMNDDRELTGLLTNFIYINLYFFSEKDNSELQKSR
jgi:hypothetical protein